MKGNLMGVYFGLLVLVAILSACQTTNAVPTDQFSYDLERAEQAASQLSYSPELPAFIPVDMVMMVSDVYEIEGVEALDLSFYTQNNDLLTLQIFGGEIHHDLIDPEEVAITKELDGIYADNSFAKTVSWQKDGITYKMTFRASNYAGNKTKVNKSDLLDTAESFHF